MPDNKVSRVRWALVFLLLLLSAVAFLDRVNISIAGSSIAQAYGLSNTQLGYVFSAFLAGYSLFQTVGGRLADQLGSRRVLAGGVLWWGLFTALSAIVPTGIGHAVFILLCIRFLLGAGEAVVYPASNQFVAQWIPPQERGVANGIIFAGVGVGAGLSPPLITFVMLHYGWRMSFWVCATIGIVAGSIWFLAARDTPEKHPLVSPSELDHIRKGLPRPVSGSTLNLVASNPVASKEALVPWAKVLQSKDVWAVTVSYFCYGYVAWIFFSWFYIYLATIRGLNLKASAFYAMLPFLAMAVACPLGGILSDRLTISHGPRLGRCGLAGISIGLAAIFLILGSHAASARLASVVLAGGAGALYLAQSSFWSVAAGLAGSSSGSVSGFMNMGAQLGGMTTASLTPIIAAHFGWTASFLVAAGLCGLGAILWMAVNPENCLTTPLQRPQEMD
ncbi:MAG TPA: MFS transporter [Terriglobales bacterium]|nr:MFS transporter [Terriglobales bacterium]